MVAVAAGRRPVLSRRRSGCGAGQQQPQAQQQRMLAVAVAARVAAAKPAATEAALYGGGDDGCCVDFLVCLLRSLGVTPASTGPAQFKFGARPLRRKRSSPRVLSAVGRRPELKDAPSRIACNGACATASLYTMQGKKGVNQDAMVVMEVYQLSSSSCLYFIPLLSSFFYSSPQFIPYVPLSDMKLVLHMLQKYMCFYMMKMMFYLSQSKYLHE